MTENYSAVKEELTRLQSKYSKLEAKYKNTKEKLKSVVTLLNENMKNEQILMEKYESLKKSHDIYQKYEAEGTFPLSTAASLSNSTALRQIEQVNRLNSKCSLAFNTLVKKLKAVLQSNKQLEQALEVKKEEQANFSQIEALKASFSKEKVQLENRVAGLEAELNSKQCVDCANKQTKLNSLEKQSAEQFTALQDSAHSKAELETKALKAEQAKVAALVSVLSQKSGLAKEIREPEPVPSCIEFINNG